MYVADDTVSLFYYGDEPMARDHCERVTNIWE